MPARVKSSTQGSESEDALQVQRDHEAIAGLADDLLPALIAKLAASGLGEIEVRQGGWKARLRMPAATDESSKSAAKPLEGHAGRGQVTGRGAAVVHARADGSERRSTPIERAVEEPGRIAAKSPAVGVYQPRKDLAVGMRVRSGERIGHVNVLGVNQDVVSPVDGVIGSSLAESGEAVEYGQELVRIDLPERQTGGDAGRVDNDPSVAGKA
jgi:biotin carboxyl carrier protein